MQSSPYILPLVLATLVAAVLAFLIWRRRAATGAAAFTFVFLGEAFWSLCNALQWLSASYEFQYFFFRLRFLGTEITSVAFLVFAIQYTRRVGEFKRVYLAYLSVLPLLNLVALWTNDWHHLFFTKVASVTLTNFTALAPQFGIGFWFHTAYDYTILSAGILILLFSFINSPTLYRGQILAVLVTTLLPLVSNALYLFTAWPFPYFDLTPIGFIIGGVPLAFGLFRFRALDIVPAARDAVLESMNEAVIVLDMRDRIVDVNPAAEKILARFAKTLIGQDAVQVLPILSTLQEATPTNGGAPLKLTAPWERGGRHYELRLSQLRDHDQVNGQLLIFYDVTDRLRAEEAIRKAKNAAQHELEIGRQIQAGFLPDDLPQLDGWELAAVFQPAREVAGDFYDAFPLSNGKRLGLIVADVCDKGVGAALFMALFRSLFRALADQHYSTNLVDLITDSGETNEPSNLSRRPRAMLSTGANALKSAITFTNNYIATVHGKSNMFATVFFGVLDPATGRLIYINGGQEAPAIVGADGIKARLEPTGPAVGMLPGMEFRLEEVSLEPGDIFVAFTDGVTDAHDPNGKSFTEERVLSLLNAPAPNADTLLRRVDMELKAHIGGTNQFDDITLLAVRHVPVTETRSAPGPRAGDDEIELDAQLENLPAFHEFVQKACERSGADSEALYALRLGVDEVCTNIIKYAYPDRDHSKIRLTAQSDASNLTITVTDYGKPFPPDNAPQPDVQADWQTRRIGGLGLYLVKQMMDQVHYASDGANGNHLTLVKKLKSAAKEAS